MELIKNKDKAGGVVINADCYDACSKCSSTAKKKSGKKDGGQESQKNNNFCAKS